MLLCSAKIHKVKRAQGYCKVCSLPAELLHESKVRLSGVTSHVEVVLEYLGICGIGHKGFPSGAFAPFRLWQRKGL